MSKLLNILSVIWGNICYILGVSPLRTFTFGNDKREEYLFSFCIEALTENEAQELFDVMLELIEECDFYASGSFAAYGENGG